MQSFLVVNNLINLIISLIFGIIVIFKNKKSRLHQVLFLFIVSLSIWQLGYWQWASEYENYDKAIFWLRILSFGSSWIPIIYFHWISLFLEKANKFKKVIIFSYILGIIFSFLSFTKFFIFDTKLSAGFEFWPIPGIMYPLYLFCYAVLVVSAIFLLIKEFRRSFGLRRQQIKYVLVASVLASLGGATNFFLWYDIPIKPYGNILVVLYPVLFSYAIIKHRLLDIKLILRASAVYMLSLFTIVVPIVLIKYFSLTVLDLDSNIEDILLFVVSVAIFPKVTVFFYRFANKYLFTSLYDSKEVIEQTTNELKSILDIDRIYRTVSDIITKAFHCKSIGILTYSDLTSYSIRFSKGLNVEEGVKFVRHEELRNYISSNSGVVILSEMPKEERAKHIQCLSVFKRYEIEAITELSIKGKIIGYIILGPKESGDGYNDEDIRVLKNISSQMAVIMDNALMYDKVKNFNIKLEHEVYIATRDLRKANAKLKKLDQAKSEFISIASHQLRTPLTVIKGYISMMLEGNFGPLSKKVKDPMEKVFLSNERLINLVEGLLGVSRIESGRMQFEFKKEYLENVVVSVVDELNENAVKKNLMLLYDAPKKALPEVNIDQEKIRQVILNLIDNGIKYTKEGVIKVTLEEIGKKVRFCVFDSGVGIREEDFHNLFKKFSRGQGVSILNTEGTGLGLYVAKEVIKAHGGKIWAESWGEGQGSKFCFEIPTAKSSKAPKTEKKEEPKKPETKKKKS